MKRKTHAMKTEVLLLPALAAALLAAAPAAAGDQAATRQVSVDPVELTTQDGARDMLARINAAAQSACREENRGGAAYELSVRLCVEDTLARTVSALDAPPLTAHHNGDSARIQLASAQR